MTWHEVTIKNNRAALARFAEALLVTKAQLGRSYLRSAEEWDALVQVSDGKRGYFREIAKPVHMGPAATLAPLKPQEGSNDDLPNRRGAGR